MTDTTGRIKTLAKWLIFLTVVSVFIPSFEGTQDNPLLADYLAEQNAKGLPAWFFWLGIPELFAFIVSLYGLLTEKRWAKLLFIGSAIAGYLLDFAMDPTLVGSLTELNYALQSLVMGMIIALLIWTPSEFSSQKPAMPFPNEPEKNRRFLMAHNHGKVTE